MQRPLLIKCPRCFWLRADHLHRALAKSACSDSNLRANVAWATRMIVPGDITKIADHDDDDDDADVDNSAPSNKAA